MIDELHLTDYKVRVINSKDETSAKVRVVIEWRRTESADVKETFGTIGVKTWMRPITAARSHGRDRCRCNTAFRIWNPR